MSGPPAPVKAILKQFSSGREEDKMSGWGSVVMSLQCYVTYMVEITTTEEHGVSVLENDRWEEYLSPYVL